MNKKSRKTLSSIALTGLVLAIIGGGVIALLSVERLDTEIRRQFDGKRWSLPALVYARPLELYAGLQLSPERFAEELDLGGYRRESVLDGAGSYRLDSNHLELISRGFHFPSGFEPSQRLRIDFAGERVTSVVGNDRAPVPFVRLDPIKIGSFHPTVHEDRIIVERADIPELLVETLLLIEDRAFFDHHGISVTGLMRAALANIKAGSIVQGGSTITQQLVKNLFLDQQRSFVRKAREALMAILLERHYAKNEILTAYINEVFLGQDRNRAIHGFALAGSHYFRRELQDLRPDQIAALVGMVKGPSFYDPYRHPERCRQRRDLVLAVMAEAGLVSTEDYQQALQQPITETTLRKDGLNRFPAFLDLVRHQLDDQYREDDLTTDGLQIMTTFNPQIQLQVEAQLRKIAARGAVEHDLPIEGAVLITARETGDVLALAGSVTPGFAGFNRAMQARRPIGSLIKPAVFLAALNSGYTLASPVDDTAIVVNTATGEQWRPNNYDRREHGRIPLFVALANSYNLATVRLGLEIGLDMVIDTLAQLGYRQPVSPYPSLLLGAVDMSPLEVCQIFQTIAAGGFFTPLRAIDSVMAADRQLLDRYGLAIEQRFSPESVFLLQHALQRVVSEGTATSLLRSPRLARYAIAGKTGTSDDLRDSWFAGFTGDHLGVVWLGRDDNTPTGLTGSSGAMQVWQRIFEQIPTTPLTLSEPQGVTWTAIDRTTMRGSARSVPGSTVLPFQTGSEPVVTDPLAPVGEAIDRTIRSFIDTLNELLR